jgi:ribosomal protein L11 methyltransferase
MKWLKITIETTTEAEDIIISALCDLGLAGAQIEDNVPLSPTELKRMFVDMPLEAVPDDKVAYLHFFTEIEAEQAAFVAEIENKLRALREFCDIGSGKITLSEVDEADFRDKWKEHFHQFAVGDVLIVPSWEEPESAEAYQYLLRIDPGAAFGTGAHETTQMCIRQLRQHVKGGERVLDIGCGSGILGILALMFGAKEVCATDLDPAVPDTVRENCQANGISSNQLTVHLGDLAAEAGLRRKVGADYDLAVANIAAPVLVALAPAVHSCLKLGGIFITSGILEEKESQIAAALASSGFCPAETMRQGEWVCITAVKQ